MTASTIPALAAQMATPCVRSDREVWSEIVARTSTLEPHEVPMLWRFLMEELALDPPPIPDGTFMSPAQWLDICRTSYGLFYKHALNEAGVAFHNEALEVYANGGGGGASVGTG